MLTGKHASGKVPLIHFCSLTHQESESKQYLQAQHLPSMQSVPLQDELHVSVGNGFYGRFQSSESSYLDDTMGLAHPTQPLDYGKDTFTGAMGSWASLRCLL